MSLPGARPLSDGRPYSIEMLAPWTVHSARTCGLPPPPVFSSVIFCALTAVVNAAARTKAINEQTNRRMLEPPDVHPFEPVQQLSAPDYTRDGYPECGGWELG